jgi:hypothetical protein
MKKYAILTFHDAKNYGAALQMYALFITIKKMGYSPEILRYYDSDYLGASRRKRTFFDIYRLLKNNNFNLLPYIKTKTQRKLVKKKFDEFKNDYFVLSDKEYYSEKSLIEANKLYQGFITGSDMVWSDIGQNLSVFFLEFADQKKRISYAPSITGTEKFDEQMNINMKRWIEGIRFLSCRELSGVKYIHSLTNRNSKLVLDPTLLIDKNEWIDYLKLNQKVKQDYILCYVFGGLSKSFSFKLNSFAKKNKLKIRYIPNNPKEFLLEKKKNLTPIYGPRELPELFLNAKYIVTNTFHGLAFSIIFEKNFLILSRSNKAKMSSHGERLTNLLSITRIENRFYDHHQNLDSQFENIDFENAKKRLLKARRESLEFLSNALLIIDKE